MTSLVDVGSADYLAALEADLERRREGRSLIEDGERLSCSLHDYIREAWHVIQPEIKFVDNWHIGAICEMLEEVSAGRCRRLMIWVPPGSTKTISVSVMWPTWEWTREPALKYMTGSYDMEIAIKFGALPARMLLKSPWYQERWGHVFRLSEDQNKRDSYANDRGGARYCIAPNAEKDTGVHAHRVILDDPNRAKTITETEFDRTNDWHDESIGETRWADYERSAKVVIQQRVHEKDLSGHLLEQWDGEILALPESYWPDHPFVWPSDPRKEEGELLWPARFGEEAHANRVAGLGSAHRVAGQLQQWPTAREGEIFKRSWWQFYDPRIRAEDDWSRLPKFDKIVLSVDTPLKDKKSNDFVAIQCWGVSGGLRYLLDLEKARLNFSEAKRRIIEMSLWARKRWRHCAHVVLIENAGYGVELVVDLKRELTGVHKISVGLEGDKVLRAEAASGDVESGNVFLPGHGPPWQPAYDDGGAGGKTATPAKIVDFIDSLAKFPKAKHDDDVDACSQALNWLRSRRYEPLRMSSALKRLAGTRR